MKTLDDWNGAKLSLAESTSGVLAFPAPFGGLLRGKLTVWPSAEIVQKLYRSQQERAFKGENHTAITKALGYYCDLQSVHSEDAITWSVFGPIAYANSELRREFCEKLFTLIDSSLPTPSDAEISLWQRVPHPDTLVPNGPEIDFLIQTPDVVIFGETKWLSSVGKGQGEERNKDQITLRREFFEKCGQTIFPGLPYYVVLGASLGMPVVEWKNVQLPHATLLQRDLAWDEIVSISPHPLSEELPRYYEWKKSNSRTR